MMQLDPFRSILDPIVFQVTEWFSAIFLYFVNQIKIFWFSYTTSLVFIKIPIIRYGIFRCYELANNRG